MELYAFFHRKDEEIRSQHCVVEKVLELSEREFARFYQSPLAEYDFIAKYRGVMRQDADGTRHCLLVLGENQEDGILVDAEGYDHARYHAFLPKARQLYLLDQYPSIAKFNREMAEMAEQYTQKAITCQQSGMYRILTDELALDKVEVQLLVGMLEDRPEIAYLDDLGDELCIKLNPEYAHEEKELPRLSQEDDREGESNSIQNQKKILQKAAKDKGYTDTIFFVDDGITGTTMKRPGFQKMIAAIEAGYISAVFVKDLSRLGRNYIEVGKLTEEFFPLHDVRLVAVSDGVDSDEGEDDFTPFKNIMNEYYAKDISKKRRIVNKMKGNAGVPLSPPPYGYIKKPDDPRFWVVEPEAAEVVRRIYRMALEGYGLAETAAQLAADGVVNPTYYWRSRGTSRGGSKSTVEPTKWGHTTVKKILTLQEYCGDVINFKSYSKSYKMKKRIENPEENRAIFLNVHEAIIDRQTWEKVQALQKGTRRKKPTVTQEPSVFSGLLKCPECGGNLNFHFNQNNHDIKFFSCQNHNSGYRKCSKTHYIRLDFLEQVVLYEVKRLACFASEYENDFIKAMIGRSAKVAENTALRKQRELDALTARDRELDMLFERLYEDNVAGKIDDARFAKMSKRYEQEQGENAKKIKALRLELKKDESKRMDIDDFLETVRRYTDATTITKRMVAELIDHIEVYHAEKQDGVTNQRVVIYYNCIGAFDVPDRRKIPEADIIMETRKGVALSYAPEQVAV